MIFVIATINIKPGSADKVIAAAMPCIEGTRAEAGCISYDLNQAVEDENTLTFVERWKTREDLELHFKQPHMAVWRETGGPYIIDRKIEIIHTDKVEVV
ncbi:MAG: antibiotic biosynthesis monooxygenase [Rhizobiales bacterium]|nr:antibiotic biosynthesis monooxygenase [Hyphomicrobiales bacterium]NRB13270.1 antibiotic biosynthesis monooxygenase [Hyphomicrobiales bacterium]